MAKKKINVQGSIISIMEENDNDYISLTDIAKGGTNREPREAINSWLRNEGTINFLEAWEQLHDINFKPSHMRTFKDYRSQNRNNVTAKVYIDMTETIGIISKSGRYGGTFAHNDIAINFCYWLSPQFQVYLIKEYQQLKIAEFNRLSGSIPREITKANYGIVTGIIDSYLIGTKTGKAKNLVYASEANVINLAVFGLTAKEWRQQNPTKKGNIRDNATTVQLQVVSNIEMLHSYLVVNKVPKSKRLTVLTGWAKYLLNELPKVQASKRIKTKADKQKKLNK